MTSPLERLDARIDSGCLVETCSKQGCTIGLKDAPGPYRLIDLDHDDSPAGKKSKRCDYLFIGENDGAARLHVVPLELKSSGIKVRTVSSQLRAGAKIAERIVRGASSHPFRSRGRPRREAEPEAINDLAKPANGVAFRGERYSIRLIRCGVPLSWAL